MERAYDFIKITLLGFIVGVLIILLLQIIFWAHDIKKALRKSVVYQNNEYRKELLEKKCGETAIYQSATWAKISNLKRLKKWHINTLLTN